MNSGQTKFEVSPSIELLSITKQWLSLEAKNNKEGFYCNWNLIENAYEENRMVIFRINDNPIGFIVWTNYDRYITLDFLEVSPEFRKQGIGQDFYLIFEEWIRKKGYIAIKLFCSPKESERFWRKMNFIQFPERGYSESDLTFYKPLIETKELSKSVDILNKLELWDKEPFQIKNTTARWCWDLGSDSCLKEPILQPCNYNWNLRWTKNGTIIRDNKIKYFNNGKNQIEYGDFLFVTKLIE